MELSWLTVAVSLGFLSSSVRRINRLFGFSFPTRSLIFCIMNLDSDRIQFPIAILLVYMLKGAKQTPTYRYITRNALRRESEMKECHDFHWIPMTNMKSKEKIIKITVSGMSIRSFLLIESIVVRGTLITQATKTIRQNV